MVQAFMNAILRCQGCLMNPGIAGYAGGGPLGSLGVAHWPDPELLTNGQSVSEQLLQDRPPNISIYLMLLTIPFQHLHSRI